MSAVAKGTYGYFDPEASEYVITRPDTPRPWVNYLMNGNFVSMISNTGGGVAYDIDPRVSARPATTATWLQVSPTL